MARIGGWFTREPSMTGGLKGVDRGSRARNGAR